MKAIMKVAFAAMAIALIMSGCSGLVGPGQAAEDRAAVGSDAVQVSSFGSNPGNLNMYMYAPSNPSTNAAVVVAMHGCTQNGPQYASETGWSDLAEEYGFYVIYPEQKSANNQNACFNWFEPGDLSRGSGEALSIRNMVSYVENNYSAVTDSSKKYVTGLSAGAYMVTVMMATYPDVFDGGATMAGGPYRCATSMTSAFSCMSPGVDKTPSAWGNLVRNAYSSYNGPYPIANFFHGDGDYMVKIDNMYEAVEQWTNVLDADQTADVTEDFRGAIHKVWNDATGTPVVESYEIPGMGHAITVDIGTDEDQGGATGGYAVDKDIWSSYYAAEFWGLLNPELTPEEAVAAAKAALEVSYEPGDSASAVRQDVTLATAGTEETTVSWASSNTAVIAADGTVTRPAIGAGDATVTLTATISKETASDTKTFVVTVKQEVDPADALAEAVDALDVGYVAGDSASSVTADVTLVTSGLNGTTVSWASNNAAISTSGAVTRSETEDVTVTLTATVTLGALTDTKTFVLTVIIDEAEPCWTETATDTANNFYIAGTIDLNTYLAYGAEYGYTTPMTLYKVDGEWLAEMDIDPSCFEPATDEEAVADGIADLVVGYAAGDSASSVTADLTLATSGSAGTSVSWASSNTAVVAADGTVTRPAANTQVTLTATVSKGAASDTKTFTVTVLAEGQGFVCQSWTKTNSEHLAAGRVTSVWGYYYAVGSSQYVGYGSYATTTVSETDEGYYEKGSCD